MTHEQCLKARQAFEEAKSALAALWEPLAEVERCREENRFVSTELAKLVSEIIARYVQRRQALEECAGEYCIREDEIDALEALLDDLLESAVTRSSARNTVMEYFRAETNMPNAPEELEKSKRRLMELCALPAEHLSQALVPYAMAIRNIRDKAPLPLNDFELMQQSLSLAVALAIDRGSIAINPDTEIRQYLDGSCELLAPEEDTGRPAASQETVTPKEPETQGAVPLYQDKPEEAPPQAASSEPEGSVKKVEDPAMQEKEGSAALEPEASAVHVLRPKMEGFAGYISNIGLTVGPDTPMVDFSTKQYQKEVVSSYAAMNAMFKVASCKIVREDWASLKEFGFPEQEAFQRLMRQKYLTYAYWTEGGKEARGYVLTSKGVEAYRRQESIKANNAVFPHVPADHTARPGQITDLSLLRFDIIVRLWMAMMHRVDAGCKSHLCKEPQKELVLGDLMLGKEQESVILFPGLFRAGTEENEIRFVQSKVKAAGGTCLILLRSLSDITPLTALMQMPDEQKGWYCFTTIEDPFTWYDLEGNPCRTMPEGNPPSEERAGQSGSFTEEREEPEYNDLSENGGAYATLHPTDVADNDDMQVPVEDAREQALQTSADVADPLNTQIATNDPYMTVICLPPDSAKERPIVQSIPRSDTPAPSSKEPDGSAAQSVREEDANIPFFLNVAFDAAACGRHDVACVMLQALRQEDTSLEPLYQRFAYAVNDPAAKPEYRFSKLQEVFPDNFGYNLTYDALGTAAYLQAFFSLEITTERHLALNETLLNDNLLFNKTSHLKDALFALQKLLGSVGRGYDTTVIDTLKQKQGSVERVRSLRNKAEELLTSRLDGARQFNNRLQATRMLLFGNDSMLREVLQAVKDDAAERLSFVLTSLNNFFTPSVTAPEAVFNEKNADQFVTEKWEACIDAAKRDKFATLTGNAKVTTLRRVEDAMRIGAEWAAIRSISEKPDSETLDILEVTRGKIKNHLHTAQEQLDSLLSDALTGQSRAALYTLKYAVHRLADRLENVQLEPENRDFYVRLLETNHIALRDDMLPVIEKPQEQVTRFDFLRRAQEHLRSDKVRWDEAIRRIFRVNEDMDGYDLGCAQTLHGYLLRVCPDVPWPRENEAKMETGRDAWLFEQEQDFLAQIDMAESNLWIEDDKEKEQLLHAVLDCQKSLYAEKGDYGFYCRAMRRGIQALQDKAVQHRQKYLDQLMYLRASNGRELPIYRDIQAQIDCSQFAIAQAYIDLTKEGQTELISAYSLSDMESVFQRFLHSYDENYRKLKQNSQLAGGDSSRPGMVGANAFTKTGNALLDNWSLSADTRTEKPKNILVSMDFAVNGFSRKESNHFVAFFEVQVGVQEFRHPIADFGSKMLAGGLDVFVVMGKTEAPQLAAEVQRKIASCQTESAIFLLNMPLELRVRRHFASIIKHTPITTGRPFLLVDPVLALFVSEQPKGDRWNALLKCALPFQYLNPYFENSTAVIPPEMFIGRREELRQITSPSGANLIYGGRQLGKTALMHRARTLEHNPAVQKWAVFADIKDCGMEQSTDKIFQALADASFLKSSQKPASWDSLLGIIKRRLKPVDALPRLLLLLDESDYFLKKSEEDKYKAIFSLRRLQMETDNRFKFVLAGLHDVVRFHQRALEDNSVLAQMASQPIRPLKYQDACELLERPLSYLGYTMQPGQEALVAQILYATNYFPGLIHFYVSRMIESLCQGKVAVGASEPPYPLNKDRVLQLLKDSEFLKHRTDKFLITLTLDGGERSYYFILAHALGYFLCEADKRNEPTRHGVSAIQIKNTLVDWNIQPVRHLGLTQISALLDELTELNILRSERINGETLYAFSRPSFRGMLGSEEEIQAKLLKCAYSNGDAI